MKKRMRRITATLCAILLLFALLPLSASGAGGEVPLKVKGTDVTEMKFMRLTNRGNMPPISSKYTAGNVTKYIVLEGKKVATGVGSMDDGWDFTLYVNYEDRRDKTGLEPVFSYKRVEITHEVVRGTEKGVLVYYTGEPGGDDPEEQAATKQKNKNDTLDQIKKVSSMPKDEAMNEMGAEKVPFPETVYMADFSITGNGYSTHFTQTGIIVSQAGEYTTKGDVHQYIGTRIYAVTLTIDEMGYAKAVIKLTDCNGIPQEWMLEGYMGAEQPQKPKQPPKPPKEDPEETRRRQEEEEIRKKIEELEKQIKDKEDEAIRKQIEELEKQIREAEEERKNGR